MDKDKHVNEIYKVISDEGYETSRDVCAQIFDEFYDRKERLIDLLRKHPNWDEDNLMIWFQTDYTRDIDCDRLCKFRDFLATIVKEKFGVFGEDGLYTPECERVNKIYSFIYSIHGQFFDESMSENIEAINKLNSNYKLRTNMKASKAILKICREEGWNKLGGTYLDRDGKERSVFDREYAAFSDALNPLKQKRHTILSVNPVDYLYMSNGTSWNSCHDISDAVHPGCYSAGTISYMLDSHSFVFYTLHEEFNGENPSLEPKINRQMFGFNNGTLFQSRLYPQGNDGATQAYTQIREIVQRVIAECLGEPNLWNMRSDSDFICECVAQDSGACNYPDWEYNDSCRISKIKSVGEWSEITMGAQPICVTCGGRHTTEENISCCGKFKCKYCGARLDEDDAYWCEDVEEYRCGEHSFYCEDCESYHAIENEIEVKYLDYYGNTCCTCVCKDCLEETYVQCEECGEWWQKDDCICIDDEWYCPECEDELLVKCNKCGKFFTKDKVTEIDGEHYCVDCLDEVNEKCEICGEWHLEKNMVFKDGDYYCAECAKSEVSP